MKKTLMTLVAGAVIGSGTTLTLPDGSTATAEAPTAADIYDAEAVTVLKLIDTGEGKAARYVIEKTTTIEGVAPLSVNGTEEVQDQLWQEVADAARDACEEDEACNWLSMDSARNTGGTTTAQITNSVIVTIGEELPALQQFKAQLLEEN